MSEEEWTKDEASSRGRGVRSAALWLLIIIYLAFISLGLPDSLLGSAWPRMQQDIKASFGSAGIVSMIVSLGTILSSLMSGRAIQRFGTGRITFISCCLTAAVLFGFSVSNSLRWLVVLAVPLGLGAGAVDSALNHYVAENYKARHMNWLHSFWGVGATIGPAILSYSLAGYGSWRMGYAVIAAIQSVIASILLISLPLWGRVSSQRSRNEMYHDQIASDKPQQKNVLRINGVKQTFLVFLLYCGVEATVGLWGASYLASARGITAEMAAGCISIYYGGITVGRLVTGFVTMKVNNRTIILFGQLLAVIGVIVLMLPSSFIFYALGFVMIGLGFAPIYPALIHETPSRFGSENSARLIGYQMAFAYTGTTFLPPMFGAIAEQTGMVPFPFFVLAYILLMLFGAEKVNRVLNLAR
jgi:fucose permease